MPVGLQVSTTVSDGALTMEEVFDAAHEAGLDALILTDRDVMRWEYGLWPFRRLLKKTIEFNSISTYGYSNYLRDIEFRSKKYPDLIVIPGAEVAPFYYWSGLPFARSLKLNAWHRHILVIGLTDAADLWGIPNVARPFTVTRGWRWLDVFRLFPFALLGLGVFLFFRRECHYKVEKGVECSRFALRWRITGVAAALLGILFFTNETSFLPVGYDQYTRDAGYRPYQALIDYVRGHGGLTFWSHVEAGQSGERDGVRFETAAHPEAVLATKGATGFVIFPDGYKLVGEPGGQWDQALLEYCRGERETPVWAVAAMSFDQGSKEELLKRMKSTRTYVLGEALNWHDLLEAMRGGRMYATTGGGEEPLLVGEFSIMDSSTGLRAGPGRETIITGSPVIVLTADKEKTEEEKTAQKEERDQAERDRFLKDKGPKDISLTVIRNGEVIKQEMREMPLHFIYVDPQPLTRKSFYRAVIKRGPQIIATNPIFVQPKEPPTE